MTCEPTLIMLHVTTIRLKNSTGIFSRLNVTNTLSTFGEKIPVPKRVTRPETQDLAKYLQTLVFNITITAFLSAPCMKR